MISNYRRLDDKDNKQATFTDLARHMKEMIVNFPPSRSKTNSATWTTPKSAAGNSSGRSSWSTTWSPPSSPWISHSYTWETTPPSRNASLGSSPSSGYCLNYPDLFFLHGQLHGLLLQKPQFLLQGTTDRYLLCLLANHRLQIAAQ